MPLENRHVSDNRSDSSAARRQNRDNHSATSIGYGGQWQERTDPSNRDLFDAHGDKGCCPMSSSTSRYYDMQKGEYRTNQLTTTDAGTSRDIPSEIASAKDRATNLIRRQGTMESHYADIFAQTIKIDEEAQKVVNHLREQKNTQYPTLAKSTVSDRRNRLIEAIVKKFPSVQDEAREWQSSAKG